MTMSINTNLASMAALASLNQTNTDLSETQNEVSTGKSIGSASDNPAVYSIAQTMNAQISTLKGVSSGLQFASQTVNTASQGASNIASTLKTLQTTVAGYTTGQSLNTINGSLSDGLKAINTTSSGSTFQGVNLLAGSTSAEVSFTSVTASQDINGDAFTQNGFNATATGLGLQGLSMDMKGATLNMSQSALVATGAAASVLTLSNQAAQTPATATAANPATTTEFVLDSAPGSASGAGSTVAATITTALGTTSGLSVTVGSTGAISVAGATATSVSSDGTTTYTGVGGYTLTVGQDESGNATYSVGSKPDANGNATALTNVVDVNTHGAASNNEQTTSLMDAVSNSGFGISRAGDGTLTIAGGNLNAVSGVHLTAGGTADPAAVTGTKSGTDVVQLALNGASNKLSQITSTLGNATVTLTQLQSTNSSLSTALTTGVGALTDADLAAESAKLTSLQTKQQLAIQSLSIANAQSQTLLKLFQG